MRQEEEHGAPYGRGGRGGRGGGRGARSDSDDDIGGVQDEPDDRGAGHSQAIVQYYFS